jgi:hypothetical protein
MSSMFKCLGSNPVTVFARVNGVSRALVVSSKYLLAAVDATVVGALDGRWEMDEFVFPQVLLKCT